MKIFVILWLSHVRKSGENLYFTINLFEQKNFFSWPQDIIWCYSNILIEHQPFSTSHSDWVNSTMICNRGISMKFLPKVPNFLENILKALMAHSWRGQMTLIDTDTNFNEEKLWANVFCSKFKLFPMSPTWQLTLNCGVMSHFYQTFFSLQHIH